MKIITIANQKGGVGKTASANAIVAALARAGKKVLAIDMDPQGNLSYSLGATAKRSMHTIYSVLRGDDNLVDVIRKTETFDIIPSNIMLATIEKELDSAGREYRLKESLETLPENAYDYIIIDTPPALGLITTNALAASQYVLIPTIADIAALDGIIQLNDTIKTIKKYINNNIKVAGILFVRHNPKTRMSKEMATQTSTVAQMMNTKVFETYIRPSVVIDEARCNAQDIWEYRPASTVAQDYLAFVDELIKEVH